MSPIKRANKSAEQLAEAIARLKEPTALAYATQATIFEVAERTAQDPTALVTCPEAGPGWFPAAAAQEVAETCAAVTRAERASAATHRRWVRGATNLKRCTSAAC